LATAKSTEASSRAIELCATPAPLRELSSGVGVGDGVGDGDGDGVGLVGIVQDSRLKYPASKVVQASAVQAEQPVAHESHEPSVAVDPVSGHVFVHAVTLVSCAVDPAGHRVSS
jgi:hypothetical protein